MPQPRAGRSSTRSRYLATRTKRAPPPGEPRSTKGRRRRTSTPPAVSRRGRDRLEVLDGREGVVEVVEQRAPLLVLGRPAEAFGVVFEAVPLDQQQIPARLFDAAFEPQGTEARHRGDDRLGAL